MAPTALTATGTQDCSLVGLGPVGDVPPGDLLALADTELDLVADRLHDGVLQSLVVARYACDAAARGADPALARDAVQVALVALRHEVWAMRPRSDRGLAAALDDLSAQRARLGQAGLLLELDAGIVAGLPVVAGATAYRLVQAVLRTVGDDVVLAVRLTRSGPHALLDLDAGLVESAVWSLRARALAGQLLAGPTRTRLLFPLTRSDDKDLP